MGVPKTTLSIDNSLETQRTHWKLLHSWLWFITAKGYRLKSAKEGAWVQVQESSKHRASSWPLPMGSWVAPPSQQRWVTVSMEYCQPETALPWVHRGLGSGVYCPHDSFQSPVELILRDSRSTTPNPLLDYPVGAEAPGQKKHSCQPWHSKGWVRSQGKDQAFFWARFNFLLYES